MDRRVEQADSVPMPQHHPHFTELVCDDSGCLWVLRPAHVDADVVTWDVFGPDGVLEGHVELPPVNRVLDVGPDYALTVRSDELDVEFVELGRLERD